MSRVLLINPPKEVPLLDWTMRYPPLGLMSVAAAVDGPLVEILDMKAEKLRKKELESRLSRADIVGVSALTPSIDSALEICRKARDLGAFTVLGGVHPSLMPNVVLRPEVDVAVRGEGELTFGEITSGKPLPSILGISYKSDGRVVHSPDRPPARLETLAAPRRDLVSRYQGRYSAFGMGMDAMSTARGCPYRCSFCCVPRVWKGYRELPPAMVIDEIERTSAAAIIAIVDDNFCHDMRRVEEICDLIISKGLDDRLYSAFSRVDSIVRHPQVVKKMARANMRVVVIGIEAATQRALDRMKKNISIQDIHRACEILEENGIMIWAGHIVGNLDDTYEDVEALIDMSRRLPVDLAQYTVITPYPGTDLYDFSLENGLIDDFDFADYCECEPPMHTTNLSRIEILELEIKGYMRFYGFREMVRRARRWSKNPAKRWLVESDSRGFRSFWKFRSRSARYFLRAYKRLAGKGEGPEKRVRSPLVSTPLLYSVSAAFVGALVTLLLTMALEPAYGDYSSLPSSFIASDFLFAGALVAFTTAIVASWFAIWSYRGGWIFSVKRRKPLRRSSPVSETPIRNAVLSSAAALFITSTLLIVMVTFGLSWRVTYGFKEVLVTSVAFLSSGIASYYSIRSARNQAPTIS